MRGLLKKLSEIYTIYIYARLFYDKTKKRDMKQEKAVQRSKKSTGCITGETRHPQYVIKW